VKSLWWPGSTSFYCEGRTQQIYVGDGLKNDEYNISYFPVLPPVMKDDTRKEKPTYNKMK
jgi:hypothetical protein